MEKLVYIIKKYYGLLLFTLAAASITAHPAFGCAINRVCSLSTLLDVNSVHLRYVGLCPLKNVLYLFQGALFLDLMLWPERPEVLQRPRGRIYARCIIAERRKYDHVRFRR